MRLFFSELKKLCGRRQFILLSAVLLIMQVFTLYAYEKVPYGRTEQDDTHNTNEGFGKRTDPYSK